ncbi:hypothetical protein YPPY14_2002, partial [Yersinia pestis PY-14]
MVTQFF